jgi:hypothetical protein
MSLLLLVVSFIFISPKALLKSNIALKDRSPIL